MILFVKMMLVLLLVRAKTDTGTRPAGLTGGRPGGVAFGRSTHLLVMPRSARSEARRTAYVTRHTDLGELDTCIAQVPLRDQRRNCDHTRVHGSNDAGRYRHWQPVWEL